MADPRFSSALESITGMRDPLAGSAVTGRRQPSPATSEDAAAAVLSDPTYQQFVGEPRKKLEKAQKAFGEFEGEMAADTAAREAKKAKRQQEAFGAYEQAVRAPTLRAERTALEERAGDAFVPTQENAREMATIFSLVGVLGFAIGAGGKNSAIQAMSAMNGMMQGYQEGRQDRYLREKDLFESNAKAIKTKIDALNNRMTDIAKLAAVDMEKANMEADMLFAQEGADFLKQYKDKMGLVNTIKMLQEQVKGGEKMYEFIEKEKSRAAEKEAQRQFQRGMQEDRQQAARDLRVLAAGLKGDGRGGQKLTEKDRSAHRLRENLIPELEEGIDTLDRLNKEGQWSKMTTLLAADTRAAELAFKDDPEALKLIRTFAFFRSKEFETGGKALTRIEDRILAPLYRSDLRVYEAVRNAMVQGVTEMSREKARLEEQFPGLGGGVDRRGEIPAPKSMPTGDKLKAYAEANFGGDEAKAKKFLSSQGYQ
jgi:hypothetical protein